MLICLCSVLICLVLRTTQGTGRSWMRARDALINAGVQRTAPCAAAPPAPSPRPWPWLCARPAPGHTASLGNRTPLVVAQGRQAAAQPAAVAGGPARAAQPFCLGLTAFAAHAAAASCAAVSPRETAPGPSLRAWACCFRQQPHPAPAPSSSALPPSPPLPLRRPVPPPPGPLKSPF